MVCAVLFYLPSLSLSIITNNVDGVDIEDTVLDKYKCICMSGKKKMQKDEIFNATYQYKGPRSLRLNVTHVASSNFSLPSRDTSSTLSLSFYFLLTSSIFVLVPLTLEMVMRMVI